jgi:hypothetical protein
MKAIGVENLTGKIIEGAGEFLPLETPEAFVQAVRDFAKTAVGKGQGGIAQSAHSGGR